MTDEQIKELFGFMKSKHKLLPVAEFVWQFYAKFADDDAFAALIKVNEVIKETTWQPIETAPKDSETQILIKDENGLVHVGYWHDICKFVKSVNPNDGASWMPIPQ